MKKEGPMMEIPPSSEPEEETNKRKQIQNYLQGIEDREESVYRLSPDDRFITDPQGIDPLELLPEEEKARLLGKFIRQRIPYKTQSIVDIVNTNPREWRGSGWAEISGNQTPEIVLDYENGYARVSYDLNLGKLEVVFAPYFEPVVEAGGLENGITLGIWSEAPPTKKGKFLGVDIRTQSVNIIQMKSAEGRWYRKIFI